MAINPGLKATIRDYTKEVSTVFFPGVPIGAGNIDAQIVLGDALLLALAGITTGELVFSGMCSSGTQLAKVPVADTAAHVENLFQIQYHDDVGFNPYKKLLRVARLTRLSGNKAKCPHDGSFTTLQNAWQAFVKTKEGVATTIDEIVHTGSSAFGG